jgi:probable rRNA maturation factor
VSARLYRPPWRVDLTIRRGVPRILSRAGIVDAITLATDAAGAPRRASIGLILTNDPEIAELNASEMGHEGPTDVLSFPLLDPTVYPAQPGQDRASSPRSRPRFVLPPGRRVHLGDIVVSVERAIQQAESGRGGQTSEVRWSPADELRLLVTHGALHLCGWDHADPREESAMRALERRLLAADRRGA